MKVISNKPSGPWYSNYDYWTKYADKYIEAYKKIPKESDIHLELENYQEFLWQRLIFESNLMEDAGLSRGDTKKVVEFFNINLPETYQLYKETTESGRYILEGNNFVKELKKYLSSTDGEDDARIIISLGLSGTRKNIAEVYQHFIALQYSMIYVNEYRVSVINYIIKSIKKHKVGVGEGFVGYLNYLYNLSNNRKTIVPNFFSMKIIKNLHLKIADGLLPDDCGVKAGEFRIDSRMVGDFDLVFPSPKLLEKSMEKFIKESNEKILSVNLVSSIWDVTADITYDLVRIHPFPDFNGRLSRIIQTMILDLLGVPFPVMLRGNKKGRSRYYSSLKRANNGDIKPLSALIAMNVVETFQEIDKNLKIADLDQIISYA